MRRVAARSVAAARRDLRRRAAPLLEPLPFVARRVAARSVAAAFRDLRRRAAPSLEPSPFVVLRCLRRRSSYVSARSFAAPRRRSVRRRRAPRQPSSPPSPLVVRRCASRHCAVSPLDPSPPRSETSVAAPRRHSSRRPSSCSDASVAASGAGPIARSQAHRSQFQGRSRGVGRGEVEKGVRATGGKKPLSQHSVSPTYDEVFDSAGVDDGKDRRSHPGCGLRGGGPRHRALPSYRPRGHDSRGARHLEGRRQKTPPYSQLRLVSNPPKNVAQVQGGVY